jgi:hypothetical protein
VEAVASYAELIDTVLGAAASLVEPLEGPLTKASGFVFLSADDAITPVHCDPEYNFLLQLRGTKRVHIGQMDRATVQQAMERQIAGGNRNLARLPEQFESFVLTPGDGVFVPPEAPHWVENGADESASLSLTFYTRRIVRAERVHDCNRLLRRIGLSPAPPGRFGPRDRAKAAAVRIGPAVKRRLVRAATRRRRVDQPA